MISAIKAKENVKKYQESEGGALELKAIEKDIEKASKKGKESVTLYRPISEAAAQELVKAGYKIIFAQKYQQTSDYKLDKYGDIRINAVGNEVAW